MRTKTLRNAKLIVKIISNKITNKIITESVYDNRIQTFWDKERIKERGIQYFLNMNDVKETLNWNLNGDDSKYQFKWGQSGKGISEGYAYIFDQASKQKFLSLLDWRLILWRITDNYFQTDGKNLKM